MSEIFKLSELDSQAFTEAMEIYQSSFPPEERHSVEKIQERITSGKEELYCLTQNGKTLGIALIWNLSLADYGVLDYFAIREDSRCMGYGGAFLCELLKRYEHENRTLIIEVEEYRNSDDPVKIARAAFYKSLGFREIIDFQYIMPPIEGQISVNMVLMFSRNFNKDYIEQNELTKIVRSIYEEMYYTPPDLEFAIAQLAKIDKKCYRMD